MVMFRYFVHFTANDRLTGSTQIGNGFVELPTRIDNNDTLKAVQVKLEEDEQFEKVMITNLVLVSETAAPLHSTQ